MTRILLPTDFSDNALESIHYALRAFKDVECTFFLLNTYMPPVYHTEYLLGSPGQIGLGDLLQEQSKTDLKKLKTRLEEEFENPLHTFITHSAFNILSSEIRHVVEKENIDMVIMGTKGATGAKEIFMGSNTVDVIKNTKCPVLAIPDGFEYEDPKIILFPTDYEVEYDEKKMSSLLEIADKHLSEINVMHVSTGHELTPIQQKNKTDLEKLLGYKALFHDVGSDEIISAINKFQIKQKINLLVMIQNKHTFIERLFIEPVIKKIGFHVTVPFMVIPQL
ncbi:universal stress protein [Maribacter sp. MMG018]|uniref:universal stress protein n=1 Tax=Maribacter sp. MMG018 TaxID=2822688 RepID=UPI001B398FA3|nr:universal stress protein [Maribacter sp. MMG018]MBQ4915939.1 universal stress protein [Maribacter sp. MMG018]